MLRRTRPRRLGRPAAVLWLISSLLLGVSLSASSSKTDSTWTLPRTAFGQPDFTGVWANNTATPLQRPKAFEGKETLSEEELAALQARLAEFREEAQAGDLLGDFLIQKVLEDPEFRGFDQQTGNYNSFWLVERKLDERTSLIIDPSNGRMPPLVPKALERLMRGPRWGNTLPAGPEELSKNERCISYGVPNILAGYNSYFRFLNTQGHMLILQELIHHARIIPLDGSAAPPGDVRFWNGSSHGRWDGDVLVVETANYTDAGAHRGATRGLRVTERFERLSEDILEWTITFDDPETWQAPWTMMIPLERSEDKIFEYACHEANYSMKGMLAGARLQEQEEKAAQP